MEASTAPDSSAAAVGVGALCNWAGAASSQGGVERRLRSSTVSAALAAHLPLEVVTRDTELHPVELMERREGASSCPVDYEFNRRADEWVKVKQLEFDTVETDVDEKGEDKQGDEQFSAAGLRECEEEKQ